MTLWKEEDRTKYHTKRQNKVAQDKIKYPIYEVEENQLIHLANYSTHAGDVEQVLRYVSVDERSHLEPGVAGERYKPVCSVDRALLSIVGAALVHQALWVDWWCCSANHYPSRTFFSDQYTPVILDCLSHDIEYKFAW